MSSCCPEYTRFDISIYTKAVDNLRTKPWVGSKADCSFDGQTLHCNIIAPPGGRAIQNSDLRDLRLFGSCEVKGLREAACEKKIFDDAHRSLPRCNDTLLDHCTECWTCKLESCPTGWKMSESKWGVDKAPPSNQCGTRYGSSPACAVGVIKCTRPS